MVSKIVLEKRIYDLEQENAQLEDINCTLDESQKYWQLEYRDLSKKYNKLLKLYHRLQSSYQ